MASARAWAWVQLVITFQLMHVYASDIVYPNILPKSSAEFLASFSCNDAILEHEDSFYRRVQSARHTTWTPGWEVAMPRFNHSSNVTIDDQNNYARVFDLLNWSREQNLLPVPIHLGKICHKGMGIHKNIGDASSMREAVDTDGGSKEDPCYSKLQNFARTSTSCIDIPGLLVANPNPPFKVNNPCHLQYRMVDGSHRLCLRKYLLTLLERELMELKELAKELNDEASTDNNIHVQMQETKEMINQTSYGLYLVINQSTFQSMLMNSDPFTTWAKSKEHLMKEFPEALRIEWEKWMARVMDHVLKWRSDHCGEECIHFSGSTTHPRDEL